MKEYDRVEEFVNDKPENRFSIRKYYKNDEMVMRQDVDAEEDKTQLFKNGVLHDGPNNEPAITILDSSAGFEFRHYQEGKLHNEKGPAIIHANYPDLNKWYLEGKELSKVEIAVQKIKIMKNKFLNKPENLNNGMDFKNKMTP